MGKGVPLLQAQSNIACHQINLIGKGTSICRTTSITTSPMSYLCGTDSIAYLTDDHYQILIT